MATPSFSARLYDLGTSLTTASTELKYLEALYPQALEALQTYIVQDLKDPPLGIQVPAPDKVGWSIDWAVILALHTTFLFSDTAYVEFFDRFIKWDQKLQVWVDASEDDPDVEYPS